MKIFATVLTAIAVVAALGADRGTGRSRWPPHLRWAAHPVDGNSAWSANWSISPWSQRNRKLKGPPCIALMVHLPGQSRIMTLEQVKELLKKGSDH